MKARKISLVVVSAIVFGWLGYEWNLDIKKRQQGYHTAAYLAQGMVLASQAKVGTEEMWRYSGELPCSNGEFEAFGLELPGVVADKLSVRVDATGCGELTIRFGEFDGTPAGKIVLQVSEKTASRGFGPPLAWECTSAHYPDIQEYLSACSFVAGAVAETD